jgi:sigma-E factor negative regulatory protein RseA
MSNEICEQLSALMDGELPRDQVRFLLRRVDAEPQLALTWTRYQLASGLLRRNAVLPLRKDFADVLMQRLAEGPTRMGKRLLRWAGGGAIAAAVAVFALVATRPGVNAPQSAPTLASVPPAASAPAETPTRNLTVPLAAALDFAQPASFDKGSFEGGVITLPHYRRDGTEATTLGPYVLLTAPPSAQSESPLTLQQH